MTCNQTWKTPEPPCYLFLYTYIRSTRNPANTWSRPTQRARKTSCTTGSFQCSTGGKIWPWLLPDKGGVSCRCGPSVRLMNGGFYLQTARELQERMSGRATKRERERERLGLLAGVGRVFSKHLIFTEVNTHAVYITYLDVGLREGTKGHQHLRVIQKLNQHGLRSSRRKTKTTPLWFPAHTHQHTHRCD